MKRSSTSEPLPFVIEDSLTALGRRISLVRRAKGITQSDLAAQAGISLSTMLSIEKGAATVQIGFVLKTLWALGLEDTFKSLEAFGSDRELLMLMADAVPGTVVESRRRRT